MGRGKTVRNVAFSMASLAGTIAKMAFDACMFNSQNFGFVKLPDDCTTGSSIMPHKKNPDVFELTRAKCNKLQALPQTITLIMNNLPCGYFRDLQIIKEAFLPAFDELKDCLIMSAYIINKMKVNEHILDNKIYDPIFSVEEVNRLAREGMPFRDAYKKVGLDIEAGRFTPCKDIHPIPFALHYRLHSSFANDSQVLYRTCKEADYSIYRLDVRNDTIYEAYRYDLGKNMMKAEDIKNIAVLGPKYDEEIYKFLNTYNSIWDVHLNNKFMQNKDQENAFVDIIAKGFTAEGMGSAEEAAATVADAMMGVQYLDIKEGAWEALLDYYSEL